MTGGFSDKIGFWYEQAYVVLQLVRLLDERNLSVQWERVEHGEDGVDVWIRRSDRIIASQCKHRGEGFRWSRGKLTSGPAGRSVLAYARARLEEDERCEYWLVTDRSADWLADLTESARREEQPRAWWSDRAAARQLAEAWEFPADGPRTPALAHALARRIRVEQGSQSLFERTSRDLARLMVGPEETDHLLQVLRRFAEKRITRPVGREELERTIAEERLPFLLRDPRVRDHLRESVQSWRESVARVRDLARIERPEAEKTQRALESSGPGSVMLVHGPAGCGKTEILGVLTEWMDEKGWLYLVVTPDRLDRGIPGLGLTEDPLGALARVAGEARTALVLDQLDTVLWAGAATQRLLEPVLALRRRARDLGVRLIAGCRTADAEHETQIRKFLEGPSGERPIRVSVGDLAEGDYAGVLAAEGMALVDLEPRVRRLAARPLHLRLIRRLLRRGVNLRSIRGLPGLVDAWRTEIAGELDGLGRPGSLAAFDELVVRMEEAGRLSVPADVVSDPRALEDLRSVGLVDFEQRADGRHVRPVHQVLVDLRIASRWADIRDPDELIGRLGPRSEQDPLTGSRLRLTVSRLHGTRVLPRIARSVAASDGVRPLVRHGLWRGMAEIEDPGSDETGVLLDWLTADLRPLVLRHVVRGSAAWMAALDAGGWLDDAWSRGTDSDRTELLDLLGAVSGSWGDGVARCLRAWAADDPGVLERAGWIFIQSPGEDSDELFEMRLASIRSGVLPRHVRWPDLLDSHPVRAAALLAVLLLHVSAAELVENRVRWAVRLPTLAGQFRHPPRSHGHAIWRELRAWWNGLPGDLDLRLVRTRSGNLEDAVLVRVVEFLASALSAALAADSLSWDMLLAELPDPLRELDGWLLLRTGAALPDEASDVADEAIDWLVSEDRWADVDVGYRGSRWRLQERFVARVAKLASDVAFDRLEVWIREYPDEWTPERERRRWLAGARGRFLPNRRGAFAYHVLRSLPDERRSRGASRLLEELGRKFDPDHERLFPDGESKGGWVVSRVRSEAAERWDVEDWLRQIRTAPVQGHWIQKAPETISTHDLDTLLSLMGTLARKRPRRFLPLALALADAGDEKRIRVARSRLFAAIMSLTPFEKTADDGPWEPLEDGELAHVLSRHAYLHDLKCARSIARVVAERASHEWPDEVVQRLEGIARGETDAGMPATPDGSGLAAYRLNESGCIALDALGRLAERQASRREDVLAVARSLADHGDPARRASAAMAAWWAREADLASALQAILEAAHDPFAAVERDLGGLLLHLAVCPDFGDDIRSRSMKRILAASKQDLPVVAEASGGLAIALRAHDAIDESALAAVLARGPGVRLGAARGVSARLASGASEVWLRDLAIHLADDEDDEVIRTIALTFAGRGSPRLVLEQEFMTRLLATRALRTHLSFFLEACDEHANLSPLGDAIIEAACSRATHEESAPGLDTWQSVDEVCALLARLVEETARTGDLELRTRALDAWDDLISMPRTPAAGLQLERQWLEM